MIMKTIEERNKYWKKRLKTDVKEEQNIYEFVARSSTDGGKYALDVINLEEKIRNFNNAEDWTLLLWFTEMFKEKLETTQACL